MWGGLEDERALGRQQNPSTVRREVVGTHAVVWVTGEGGRGEQTSKERITSRFS